MSWTWSRIANRHARDDDTRSILLAVTASQSVPFYRELAASLRDAGWRVHIAASDGSQLREIGETGIEIHPIAMRRAPAPLADAWALGKWLKLCLTVRPDVVLAGTPKASLLALTASALTRVPHRVYHVLGLRLETAGGIGRIILRGMEVLTARCATRVVAVSPSLRSALVREGVAAGAKIDVIGHGSSGGVDLDHFRPAALDEHAFRPNLGEMGLEDDRVTIGYVGRIVRDKGVADLVAALNRVENLNPGRVQLLAVGSPEEGAFAPLTKATFPVAQLSHTDDVRPYYGLMDLFCLPTHREGLPNVCLEAAAMGLPVVTTTATGAIDSVVPGVTGYLVPAGDSAALANVLEDYLRDAEAGRTMGIAGRAWVAERFDQTTVISRHADYFGALRFHTTPRGHHSKTDRQA